MLSTMDINKTIKLTQGDKYIELPLRNFLKVTFVYLNKMLPEFYDNPDKASNSVDEYWRWLKIKLEIKDGDRILL